MTSVWVYTSENHGTSIEVPITPETTVLNVLECVRDPVRGEGYLVAVSGDTEYILQEGDNAYTFLYEMWNNGGSPLTFLLRYYNQQAEWPPPELEARRQQMRQPHEAAGDLDKLPGGAGDLTLIELQEMASRQQQMLETQQQVLVAKEQRLKYLKQQEARHAQLTSESERLRKIRERVESQELKLKKLRALRSQAEQYRITNGNLNTELEAVKNVFSEKEKELAMAVARVDQLTRQLRDLKNGAANGTSNNKQAASTAELEKLRKELLMRNKLNEQQNVTITAKEKLLNQKREEVAHMDARIHELQQRLKKRQLQEQQAGVQGSRVTKLNSQHPVQSSVASLEPHSQFSVLDKADAGSGLTQQHPRFQSVPVNTKFSHSGELPEELQSIEKQEGHGSDQVEEYKLPTVVPLSNNVNFSKNTPVFPQRSAPSTRQGRLEQDTVVQEGVVSHSTNSTKIGPPFIKPPSGGSRFFPVSAAGTVQQQRPVVSLTGAGDNNNSHSTGPAGSDSLHSVQTSLQPPVTSSSSSHPIINISDEERQAGSGQSSPASSESLPSSGVGLQISGNSDVNTNSIGPVSAMIEKLNKNVQQDGQKQQTSAGVLPGLRRSNFTQKSHGPSPEGSNVPQTSNKLPTSAPIPPNWQAGTHLNTQGLAVSSPHSQMQNEIDPSRPGLDSSNLQSPVTTSPTNSPGMLPASQSPQSSSSGPHLNQKPALTYRYASKNTIANTYMGRLGSAAMEKYQRNLNLLYKNVDSQGSQSLKSPEEGSTSFAQPATADVTLPVQDHPQFGAVSSPNYPDIASDKGSFKLNTPKQVRRRHSDSENEDLNKALQEQQEREQQQQRLHQPQQQQAGNEPSQDSKVQSKTDPTVSSTDKSGPATEKDKNVRIVRQASVDSKPPEPSPNVAAVLPKSENKISSPTAVTKSASSSKVEAVLRRQKSNLKKEGSRKSNNRVSFDPLALLLDASLEGELDLVKKVAVQVEDVSTSNDEGITALHNAICAGHYDIVAFLVEFGCDVNSPDSDGWTPLHCAASCNNLPMVRFLVEHGACIFATTISDHETAADKCEEDEDGYDSCSDYLYSIQEKLGITNNGEVYAVFDYQATSTDELSFQTGSKLTVLRKGDDTEKEWWWSQLNGKEGYIPRNLLGLFPRVIPRASQVSEC